MIQYVHFEKYLDERIGVSQNQAFARIFEPITHLTALYRLLVPSEGSS